MDRMNHAEHDLAGEGRKRRRRFIDRVRNLAPSMDRVVQSPIAKSFARAEKFPRVGQRYFADRFNSRVALSVVVVDFRGIQSIEHTPKMIQTMPVMPAHKGIECRWNLCGVGHVVEGHEQRFALAEDFLHGVKNDSGVHLRKKLPIIGTVRRQMNRMDGGTDGSDNGKTKEQTMIALDLDAENRKVTDDSPADHAKGEASAEPCKPRHKEQDGSN